ncbi:MAG TPA: aldo/keto reductase [Vicinamibacterales bacterium]
METRPLGRTGLDIAPVVLGCNVFGWTVDQPMAFRLLDRFVDAGLNAVDTANSYSMWVPGNRGGESETMIGNWFAAKPGRRERVVLITKVGAPIAPDRKGLSSRNIVQAAEESLRRLRTDRIDVYLSHYPDPSTPVEETLAAYDTLIRQGKVRAIGCSNYDAGELRAALTTAAAKGLPRYEVVQPEYNLYGRSSYEGPLRDLCIAEGLGVIVYYALASGFLTGKYRSTADLGKSPRGSAVSRYLDERGQRILGALDKVAAAHDATPAEVALAWLMAREGVTAPIASATSVEQLESLIRATRLRLDPSEIEHLTRVSNPGE